MSCRIPVVAKVDELMGLCDRLEAQQKERAEKHAVLARASLSRFAEAPSPANLEFLFHNAYAVDPADLRKSVLTLAVQRKLEPQDLADQPAEALLAAIREDTRDTGRKEIVAQNESAREPFELPPGWSWSRFSELGHFARGKSRNRPRNDPKLFRGGKYPLVQTGDVARANGTIKTYTSLYNDVGLAQSKLWPPGTLCITIAANIADSGILGFEACIPDSVVGFIPSQRLPSVRYFEYFVRTAKDDLEKFAPSTAQKNINLGILEEVRVPIPPAAEQRRIVAKVDKLMALVDQLEAQLAASRDTAGKLLEAVVAELTIQEGAGDGNSVGPAGRRQIVMS
jgi:type I restriction enzyme S subunit